MVKNEELDVEEVMRIIISCLTCIQYPYNAYGIRFETTTPSPVTSSDTNVNAKNSFFSVKCRPCRIRSLMASVKYLAYSGSMCISRPPSGIAFGWHIISLFMIDIADLSSELLIDIASKNRESLVQLSFFVVGASILSVIRCISLCAFIKSSISFSPWL